jgi:hypothetical protein
MKAHSAQAGDCHSVVLLLNASLAYLAKQILLCDWQAVKHQVDPILLINQLLEFLQCGTAYHKAGTDS